MNYAKDLMFLKVKLIWAWLGLLMVRKIQLNLEDKSFRA